MTLIRLEVPLPDVPIPFPVQVPYEVKADLNKLANDTFGSTILIVDAAAHLYRAQKERIFATPSLNASQGSAPTDPALFAKVLELLELAPRPFRSADHAWRELALGLQDDLVVMRLDQEQLVPEYMQVCFPTGWDPAQKYATDLRKIHEPVANGERLQKSTFSIAQAMVHKGPFVRYVWTLAASNQLSQHPSEKIVPSAYTKQHTSRRNPTKNPINPIYLRVERQVTVPLPAWRRSLFLIRVFIAPIDSVANTVERKRLLCNSLKSMTPEIIAYKGIEPLMQQYFSENS